MCYNSFTLTKRRNKMKIKNNFKSNYSFPVYNLRVNESRADHAYISIDLNDGEVDVDYSDGNSMSCAQFNGTLLTFDIDANLANSEIKELITDISDDFQIILDNTNTVWIDGNWRAEKNDKAEEAIDRVEAVCRNTHSEFIMIDREAIFNQLLYLDFDDYKSVEEIAENLQPENWTEPAMLADDIQANEITDLVIEFFQDSLISGNNIPAYAAREILELETMPEWHEELLEITHEQ